MKKLLLFLALSVVLVSACMGKTGSVVDDDKTVNVDVNDPYDNGVQTTDQNNVDSEILDNDVTDEEDTTGSSETRETDREETPDVEFVRLVDASIDKTEVSWQDEMTVSFGIYNNDTKRHEYNIIIQIFDENDEKVYNHQEEGLSVLRNYTKQFEVPIQITNTFKRGETYTVHAGVFDEDWNLIEWNWKVGTFEVS